MIIDSKRPDLRQQIKAHDPIAFAPLCSLA